MHKDKRQQVESREEFSEETRARIQRKCDDKCVWCGKKVFLGYQGTIDHFIPLKKGGTNDEVNLVLMCHDCNQKKGSRIFPTNVAATYLADEPRHELEDYFEEFVQKYDYVSRGNLLSSDVYEMVFMPEVLDNARLRATKKGKKLNINLQRSKYLLKRAYPDDAEKLTAYFIKYLKKYNKLSSPEAALENIKFWMRFGSIYFVEKNGEIAVMSCVTINVHGYVTIDIFAYYSTLLAWTMVKGVIKCLTTSILDENDLPYLPYSVCMLAKDELNKYPVPHGERELSDGTMACKTAFAYNPSYKNPYSCNEAKDAYREGVLRFSDFIDRFDDSIDDDISLYLYQNDLMDFSWMEEEILGRDFFDHKYYKDPDTVFED